MKRTCKHNCFTSAKPLSIAQFFIALACLTALAGCNGIGGRNASPRTDAAAYAEENYEKLADKQSDQERIAKKASEEPVGPDTLFSAYR